MIGVCEILDHLPPTARRRLVEVVRDSGYSGKEIAEAMGVSQSAVSRYLRGDIAPSGESLCRLVDSLDPDTKCRVLAEAAKLLLDALISLLREAVEAAECVEASQVIEEASDALAELLHEVSA